MFDDFSFEALAHYTRGIATVFFVLFAAMTYGRRKRNGMSYLLFVTVSYIALGYIKDFIFILPYFSESRTAENLSSLFDVACTPLVCAFCVESARRGAVSRRDVVVSYLLFASFMPLYCVVPSDKVVLAAYIECTDGAVYDGACAA